MSARDRLNAALAIHERRRDDPRSTTGDIILGINNEEIRASDLRAVLDQRADLLAACEAALPALRAAVEAEREGLWQLEANEFVSDKRLTEARATVEAAVSRLTLAETAVAKARPAEPGEFRTSISETYDSEEGT
jgi:hypothetical protein